jgi:general stress protein 26
MAQVVEFSGQYQVIVEARRIPVHIKLNKCPDLKRYKYCPYTSKIIFMGDHKDLTSAAAVEKLRDLAVAADICMFTTSLSQLPLTTRPMSTGQVDDEGNIWFLSRKSSDKNKEIMADDRVQLFYGNNGNSEYLSVYGSASILFDREKIKDVWSTLAKVWFTEGEDDPEISLIKVVPEDAYYWDTKHNKFVALIKMATALVTGTNMDDGVEGTIKV